MARVTCADIAQVCVDLEEAFGAGHVFAPEPITEGGIRWYQWPGRREGAYKTFRIRFTASTCGGVWPYVLSGTPQEVVAAWLARDDDEIASPSPTRRRPTPRKHWAPVMLKAFYGAPQWTRGELEHFYTCLERRGMVRGGAVPSNAKLRYQSHV